LPNETDALKQVYGYMMFNNDKYGVLGAGGAMYRVGDA
jgi:hypothetical protein